MPAWRAWSRPRGSGERHRPRDSVPVSRASAAVSARLSGPIRRRDARDRAVARPGAGPAPLDGCEGRLRLGRGGTRRGAAPRTRIERTVSDGHTERSVGRSPPGDARVAQGSDVHEHRRLDPRTGHRRVCGRVRDCRRLPDSAAAVRRSRRSSDHHPFHSPHPGAGLGRLRVVLCRSHGSARERAIADGRRGCAVTQFLGGGHRRHRSRRWRIGHAWTLCHAWHRTGPRPAISSTGRRRTRLRVRRHPEPRTVAEPLQQQFEHHRYTHSHQRAASDGGGRDAGAVPVSGSAPTVAAVRCAIARRPGVPGLS